MKVMSILQSSDISFNRSYNLKGELHVFLAFDSLLRRKYNFWMTLILRSVYLKLLFKRENEVFFSFVILTIFCVTRLK